MKIAIKTKINFTTKRKTAYFKFSLNYHGHKWVQPKKQLKIKKYQKKNQGKIGKAENKKKKLLQISQCYFRKFTI